MEGALFASIPPQLDRPPQSLPSYAFMVLSLHSSQVNSSRFLDSCEL